MISTCPQALDEDVVAKMLDVQLFTTSHDQGSVTFAEAGSWSWFDIVLLDSPTSTVPKMKDGRSLVWCSHNNQLGDKNYQVCNGKLFDRDHELLSSLEVSILVSSIVGRYLNIEQFSPGRQRHCCPCVCSIQWVEELRSRWAAGSLYF